MQILKKSSGWGRNFVVEFEILRLRWKFVNSKIRIFKILNFNSLSQHSKFHVYTRHFLFIVKILSLNSESGVWAQSSLNSKVSVFRILSFSSQFCLWIRNFMFHVKNLCSNTKLWIWTYSFVPEFEIMSLNLKFSVCG